ncbi:MAG: hypothetical protein HY811_07060 [Planctomycetes bacterium]|nr:hypothetical protein [Planctomycetota bacterium]
MNFLKPEQKPSLFKMIFRSAEFRQFALMTGLCLLFIGTIVVFSAKWDKLFPQTAQAQGNPEETPDDKEKPPEEQSFPIKIEPINDEPQPVTPTIHGPVIPSVQPAITGEADTIFKLAIGRLDNARDGTRVEQDEPYNNLLSAIGKMTREEISKNINLNIKFNDLMKNPSKYRGALISVKGLLIVGPHVFDYPSTNPAGVTRYYAGTIFDPEKDECYRFHLIDRPQEHKDWKGAGYGDMVWVEGAFLKVERYEISEKSGGGFKEAPFIIGRAIRKVTLPTKGVSELQWVFGGIIILVTIVVIIIVIFSGKSDKKYQEQLQAKRKKKAEEFMQKKEKSTTGEDKPKSS